MQNPIMKRVADSQTKSARRSANGYMPVCLANVASAKRLDF